MTTLKYVFTWDLYQIVLRGGIGCLPYWSAINLKLWDIIGQVCGMPVCQLLGGRTQDGVRVYNSTVMETNSPAGGAWPGYGQMGNQDPLNDYWNAVRAFPRHP